MCSDVQLWPPGTPATDVLLSVVATDVFLFPAILPGDCGSPIMKPAVASCVPVALLVSLSTTFFPTLVEAASILLMACISLCLSRAGHYSSRTKTLLQHTAASLQHLSCLHVYEFTMYSISVTVTTRQQQLVLMVYAPVAVTAAAPPSPPLCSTGYHPSDVLQSSLLPALNNTGYYRPSLHHRRPMCNFSDDSLHICVFAYTLYFICVMISWQKQDRRITASRHLPFDDRYLLCMCHLRDISMSNVMQWLKLRTPTCILNLCKCLMSVTLQSLVNYLIQILQHLFTCRFSMFLSLVSFSVLI